MNANSENHRGHISKQFNQELEDVKSRMLEMGGKVEQQLKMAVQAVLDADSKLGEKVIQGDDEIDSMEVGIDEECGLILARRQPAAGDLRLVLAIIKTIRDLERMGDESAKIARMAIKLGEEGEPSEGMVEFRHIAERVAKMVNHALTAFARFDPESALEIAEQDSQVDMEYGSAIRSLATYMMEDNRTISRVLNVLWALRALERIGDHAKNISEQIVYVAKGLDVRHENLDDFADQIRS